MAQELKSCAKNQPLDNGNCLAGIPDEPKDQGCTAYCETSITYLYGREQPYPNARCETNVQCTFSEEKSISQTRSWTSSLQLGGGLESPESIMKSSFSIGASYSWSETISVSTKLDTNRPDGDNRPGYWTFVPNMVK